MHTHSVSSQSLHSLKFMYIVEVGWGERAIETARM